MYLRRRGILQHTGVTQREGVLRNSLVAFAFRSKFLQQVGANAFQRPTGIMPVQKIGRRVELCLRKAPVRLQNLVARLASRRNEHNKDRKSTRLNSSHRCNSYAVFCLKKK